MLTAGCWIGYKKREPRRKMWWRCLKLLWLSQRVDAKLQENWAPQCCRACRGSNPPTVHTAPLILQVLRTASCQLMWSGLKTNWTGTPKDVSEFRVYSMECGSVFADEGLTGLTRLFYSHLGSLSAFCPAFSTWPMPERASVPSTKVMCWD